MSDACPDRRGHLAVHALGLSTDDERVALEAHLEGCARCHQELAELRLPAGALAATDLARAQAAPSTLPDGLGTAIFDQIAAHQRHRRYHRAVLAGAAAVVLVVLLGALAVARPTRRPGGVRITLVAAPNAHTDVVLMARPWGTQLTVTAEGLAPATVHRVWLQTADGHRTPAGTFTAVRGRRIRVVLAAASPTSQTTAVGISDASGNTVALGQLGAS